MLCLASGQIALCSGNFMGCVSLVHFFENELILFQEKANAWILNQQACLSVKVTKFDYLGFCGTSLIYSFFSHWLSFLLYRLGQAKILYQITLELYLGGQACWSN
ncbi:hypothetical protein BY996DRAFT_742721 [Phakopsora pachyrhizi]|nr:hypothetical protein BY996DRAFT_742721 [Phakopsora pachyrhizi]